jgi:hypothetical protein
MKMMTQQASTTTMKRVMVLLVRVMAALVAMSTLSAPDAEAKKRKRVNEVQCTTDVTTGACNGTVGRDLLIGTDAAQVILGGEGSDVYDGKGGFTLVQNQNGQQVAVYDVYSDQSTKSSDVYKVPGNAFQEIDIFDGGGDHDVVDLAADSSVDYSFDTFIFQRVSRDPDGKLNDLLIDRGSGRKVEVHDQFKDDGTPSANKIEKFKFIDGTHTLQELFS